MEIRRIEGIIPVEAINRNLPLKWENFSYEEMRKLLKFVNKGERKSPGEFEELIKATFLGYESGRVGKFRSGDLTFLARVEEGTELSPGQEVEVSLKGLFPFAEKLRLLVNRALTAISQGEFRLLERLFTPKLLQALEREAQENAKELLPFLKSLKEKGSAFPVGRDVAVALLLLLANFDRFKENLPEGVDREKLRELLSGLFGLFALYRLLGTAVFPVFFRELKGQLYLKKEGEVLKALLELETPLGSLRLLLRALNRELSVEVGAEGALKERFSLEELKELLSSCGFSVVFCRFVEPEALSPQSQGFLRGSSLDFKV